MAVVIRLRREGTKNSPFYRIIVADSRQRRDGRYLEQIGTYDPKVAGTNCKVDLEKANAWIGKGAKPSETVASLLKQTKLRAAS